MKLGVCYYPEHWPQARWPIDAALMRQVGLSLVRIGDFAWGLIESREGEVSWNWLDQAIQVLAAQDLQIILCTPTASPPPWLCRAYPDILPVDVQGRRRRYGGRRHYCPNSPTYQKHSVRIVTALGSRYGKHPAVVGWQIDNEFGCHDTSRCYCDNCASAFRSWLEVKYKTIDALNEAWGTVFWSQIYNEWSEIDPPNLTIADPNPSHLLDYYRFSSDSIVTYQQLQISILQEYTSGHQIFTTNYMNRFTDLNYFDLAGPLDLVTMSSYPTGHAESRSTQYLSSSIQPVFDYDVGDPYITGLGYVLMRGFKNQRPFWVMEQQCGHVNWSKYNTGIRPGTVRLWTWLAVCSGAEAVLYFRWRAGLYAQEQLHSGLLNHDASPAVGYADLEVIKEERTLLNEISAAPFEAQIAILLDFDALWALRFQPHNYEIDYLRLLFVYYRALQRLGISVDVISKDADLSSYKLLITPTAYLATEKLAHALMDFVQAGGTVLLGPRSGFKNINNLVTDQPLPSVFREMAGVSVINWHSLPPNTSYEISSNIHGLGGSTTIWAEALTPLVPNLNLSDPDLKILAEYTSGPFISCAALTEHKIGTGKALYLGWFPEDDQTEALMSFLASQVGVIPIEDIPEGLVIFQRSYYLILLNFSETSLTMTFKGRDLLVRSRDVEVVNTAQL